MPVEVALLDAVTARLKADAALKPLIRAVYDEVPTDRKQGTPPYVVCGPINRTRVADACADAWDMRMRLYAISTGFGRKQAWVIADAVAKALHRWEIEFVPPLVAVGEVRVIQGGDVINPPTPKTAFVDIAVTIQE